jgi:eukaryotic-like serine/threonine-protein kinase
VQTSYIMPPENGQAVPWSFLHLLRESRLLSDDQLDQLEGQVNTTDMTKLSAHLLESEWLTAYQLKRIVEGQPRGLLLGQYRVLGELGEGGFGKVYKAVHGMMNRVAAVKVIAPKWAQNPSGRNLFLREVSAITRLTHPNIALAYDANQTDDMLWFAMEYVEGLNLEQFVARRNPLPIPFVCSVMLQVARALQFAHENGIVHRDVKPANLLLPGADASALGRGLETAPQPVCRYDSAGALVKVVDFGLAKFFPIGTPQASSICQEGACVGTPLYMSPEQARNSHRVDIRSDLYSLGCVFYFALTGRPPFQGATPVEVVTQHLEREPEPLASLRPDVPPEVAGIVHRLLAKKAERRFQTPLAFIESLNVAMHSQGAKETRRQEDKETRSVPVPLSPGPLVSSSTPPALEERLSATRVMAPVAPRTDLNEAPILASRGKDAVPALWREWFAVVNALAQGRASAWNEREYSALYKALLDGLRDDPDSPQHPQSQLHARLTTVVEPWLRLRALAELDPATLTELSQMCRRLDAEVCPAGRFSFSAWLAFIGLLAGGGVLLASYLLHGVR